MSYTASAKSAVITNLDASPIVRATAGQGAPVRLVTQMATITPGATDGTTVCYQMVRVPSNAIIRRVAVILDSAATTFTGSVGVVWSTQPSDGSDQNASVGTTPTIISQSFFAYQMAMATFAYVPGTDPANVVGLSAPVDITFANSGGNSVTDGYYKPSFSNKPFWQAMALSGAATTGGAFAWTKDPGGYFDITHFVTTTNSGAAVPYTMLVDFTGEAG